MQQRITIDESAPDKVLALAQALAREGLPHDARVIYSGRNTVAVDAATGLCVKAYKVNGLLKGLMYGMMRIPKARRAYTNALELRRLGFDTPVPEAAVECRTFWRLGRSYFISETIHGWTDLRGVERNPRWDDIARGLAQFMHNLHHAGVLMKDFSQGNVLFRFGADGTPEFCLIDINRMEFGVHDSRRLMGNFGTMLDTPEGIDRVAREYAAIAGLDPDTTARRAVALFIRRTTAIVRRHRLKDKIRRFLGKNK